MASAKSGASTSTGSKSSKFKVPLLTDPGGDRDSPVIDRTSSDDGGAQATNPGPRLNAQQFQFPAAKRAFKRPFTPPLVSAPRSSAGNAEEESSGKETEDARGQRADQKRIGAASKGPLTVPGKPPPFKRRALVSARRTVIAPATEEEGGVGGESRGNAEDVRARTRTQGGSHDADIPRAPSRTHPHPISGSSVASEREGGSTAAAEKGPPAAAKIPISIGNSENKSDAQMVTVAGAGRTTSDSVMIHASPPPPPPPPPPFHAVVDGGGATGRGSSKGAPAAAGQTTACATDSSAHAGVKHVDDEGISGDVGGSGCTMAMAASAGKRLSSFIAPRRKGLLHVLSSGRASGSGSETTAGNGRPPVNHGVPEAEEANYFSVMYCQPKRNSKRKGPWSDGVFVVRSRTTLLQDMEGKELAKGDARGCKNLQEGATARAGTYEVEVMGKVDKKDYESGSIFVGDASDAPLGSSAAVLKPMKKLQSQTLEVLPQRKRQAPQLQFSSFGKNDLVLNMKEKSSGAVPVVVDPYIGNKLRPHQREGVIFMYESIMGLRGHNFRGCLLADEMGLGKTLQVIALLWTVFKQGPQGKPALRRAVVTCPSSLVENWGNEVRKWLGTERLKPLTIHAGLSSQEATRKLADFRDGQVWPLLILSYELLRKHVDLVAQAKPGLLICDEGHRLKNCAGNKTIASLMKLDCPRRILLSGTPIQNQLNEFFAMIDFINPNSLGSLPAFKRLYATPIERSRDRSASEAEKELGKARLLELQRRTKMFVLRRTSEINAKYLPPKKEFVVFCRLHPLQIVLYQAVVKSQCVSSMLSSSGTSGNPLQAIGILRKLCNHPDLLRSVGRSKDVGGDECNSAQEQAAQSNSSELHARIESCFASAGRSAEEDVSVFSGKLACLKMVLESIYTSAENGSRDRIVVVSNYTQTLDIIQSVCSSQGWKFLRLDGTTDVSGRQSMVNRFNSGFTEEFIFLLSSKAGGTGLNLIGANRLILFDPDWNPATDAQAMARVWRDGQQKDVVIYRFLSTGSIEEKIYQRQIVKGEVAAAVAAKDGDRGSKKGQHFTREELKELFQLQTETACDTYDLLYRSRMPHAMHWKDVSSDVIDPPLKWAVSGGTVTFVHEQTEETKAGSGYDGSFCESDLGGFEPTRSGSAGWSADKEEDDRPGEVEGPVSSSTDVISEALRDIGNLQPQHNVVAKVEESPRKRLKRASDKYSYPERTEMRTTTSDPSDGAVAHLAESVDSDILATSADCRENDSVNADNDFQEDALIYYRTKRKSSAVTAVSANNTKQGDEQPDGNGGDLGLSGGMKADPSDGGTSYMSRDLKSRDTLAADWGTAFEDDMMLAELDISCGCSVEMEIALASNGFDPQDLWFAKKSFLLGFLLGVQEEKDAFSRSKLGRIIVKEFKGVPLDRAAELAFPMVAEYIGRHYGHESTALADLISRYEDRRALSATENGRFLLRQVDAEAKRAADKEESDEHQPLDVFGFTSKEGEAHPICNKQSVKTSAFEAAFAFAKDLGRGSW